MALKKGNWTIGLSKCGNYIYIKRDGLPGEVHVKSETEGYVVDIWRDGSLVTDPEVEATCAAMYVDLHP